MTQKGAKILRYSLMALLAAVLVWVAFRGVDWKDFWSGLVQTRWGWVILSMLCGLVALVLRALRWQLMLRPVDEGLGLLDVFDANNIGHLSNIALPGTGEFVRAGIATTPRATYDKVLGTEVMERLWDMLAIAVMLALTLALGWDRFAPFMSENILEPIAAKLNISLGGLTLLILLVLALAVAAIFLLRRKVRLFDRLAGFIEGLFAGFKSFGAMPHKLIFAGITIAIWVMYLLMSFTVLKAIPATEGLALLDALLLSTIGNIASVVPVPGGIGAYHYLIALTLSSLYGASWEVGVLYATLCHESHTVLVLIAGGISALRQSLVRKRR